MDLPFNNSWVFHFYTLDSVIPWGLILVLNLSSKKPAFVVAFSLTQLIFPPKFGPKTFGPWLVLFCSVKR